MLLKLEKIKGIFMDNVRDDNMKQGPTQDRPIAISQCLDIFSTPLPIQAISDRFVLVC